MIAINMKAPLYCCQAVGIYMRRQGAGSIVNISSGNSKMINVGRTPYGITKGAVNLLTQQLGAEWSMYGIKVNAIAPGWIDTPMFHKATDTDPQRLAKILSRIPAKSVGDPMDIGMVAAFLCSDAARYISGACIPVDGGALIGF